MMHACRSVLSECSVSFAAGETVARTNVLASASVKDALSTLVSGERPASSPHSPPRASARTESLSAISDELIIADSLVRFASCLSESMRISEPARSTSVSRPTLPFGRSWRWMAMRQMACEREDASCTPVADVERSADANSSSPTSPAADVTCTSTLGTICVSPAWSARSCAAAPPLRMSRAPPCASSAYAQVITSPAATSIAANRSAAAASKIARMVKVLPLPVCPYMRTVADLEDAASATRGATLPAYTSRDDVRSSYTRSYRNVWCDTKSLRQSACMRQSWMTRCERPHVTTSNSPCVSSCGKIGRRRTATLHRCMNALAPFSMAGAGSSEV